MSEDPSTQLPSVRTPMSPAEVVTHAEKLSRRGKLPGFERTAGDALFKAAAFGNPFDADLICSATESGGETTLRFETALRKKLPAIAILLLVVTIWPGVWLTDSMLGAYWPTYGKWTVDMPWLTYAWYLPVTVLPLPWMLKKIVARNTAAVDEHAREQIAKISGAVAAS